MRIGYFLSCEEYSPSELVEQAKLAEQAGFEALWISDHFHPWNDAQGESPFVWSVIGALSQVTSLPVTTAVTCPTVRVHPAIVAQAAATVATMVPGGFNLGVGSGEALNEHVLGDAWPSADVRLDMLEEAVDVIRALWTGDVVTHRGDYYDVDTARLYTLPDTPPKIYMSGFGPKAAALAGRIANGFATVQPDADLISVFREHGGEGKPMQAGYKVCWGPDDDKCVETAHRLWATAGLPGELSQTLPSPKHFEQASALVTPESTRDSIAYGSDVQRHVDAFRPYADAGFDEIYIAQMGARYPETSAQGFFEFYAAQVLPQLREIAATHSG
jgi:G6PDH family F420-dependent oxidoreductase